MDKVYQHGGMSYMRGEERRETTTWGWHVQGKVGFRHFQLSRGTQDLLQHNWFLMWLSQLKSSLNRTKMQKQVLAWLICYMSYSHLN